MSENNSHYDVIIIGSGPAGYTAGIYTGRANLNTLIFEGIERGGQLMITNEVENFPGFPEGIMGPTMMDEFRKQTEKFGATLLSKLVDKITLTEGTPFKVVSEKKEYTADAIIIATGAKARFLGIPSEPAFKGKGVSACATCDGFFYRDKHVYVVGGGDSAMEEAVFLTKFASKVTIIHRRDVFRASKIMYDRAEANAKIEIKPFTIIDEILGDSETGLVTGAKLKDPRDGSIIEDKVDGIFVAVGHDPNVTIFEGQIDLDENKFIKTTPNRTATSIKGVFAAGDVKDPFYKQAITAAGSGCQAAIEVEKYLEELHS